MMKLLAYVFIVVSMWTSIFSLNVAVKTKEQNDKIIMNYKFSKLNKYEKIKVLSKFIDEINGDEKIDVRYGNGNYFSPSRATVELSFGESSTFESYIKREFPNANFRAIDITVFTAFHEFGHSMTMNTSSMRKYGEGKVDMYKKYKTYKKNKNKELIAFQTGDADNYIEETKRSILNLHYRRIPAEKIADLVAFYLYDKHYNVLLDIINGVDVNLSKEQVMKIKKDISDIRSKYLI